MVIRTRVFGASAMGSVGWKTVPSNNASIILTIACLLFSISSRFSHRHRVTASEPPNAALQAPPIAAARYERRLLAVACKRWFGLGFGRDADTAPLSSRASGLPAASRDRQNDPP